MKSRILVVAPGRGSYGRDSLGSLSGVVSPALDVFDAWRQSQSRPGVRELDALEKYELRRHVAGEHASILTAGASFADWEALDPAKCEVVAVTGNSMGFYTALGLSGALDLDAAARLVDTMGAYQQENVLGGQILYPLVGEDWQADPVLVARVEQAVSTIDHLWWSIHLGGQAVLGGTEEALREAHALLPALTIGAHTFPLRLPLHSAFHTPILTETSEKAILDLADLPFEPPRFPLVDGQGTVWRPRLSDPGALLFYTLGPQVTEPFDFTKAIRVALREYAPDRVVLLGPGNPLGSIVAQILIAEGWSGITSREAFMRRQETDPIVIAMRWPEQRRLVT
jgi:[acyl-carrier-protein] S-malonyltransferase